VNYEAFRQFADSIWLAVMGLLYLLLVGWAFRPSKRQHNRRAAIMIFDEDSADG
jgi:cbb3-type cytochrome oxidase subunit 3